MSLASLFAAHGLTSPLAATRLVTAFPNLTSRLFEMVDARSQALPIDVAQAIAAMLGVHISDVLINVRRTTTAVGELSRVALPPLLGSSFQPLELSMPSPADRQPESLTPEEFSDEFSDEFA